MLVLRVNGGESGVISEGEGEAGVVGLEQLLPGQAGTLCDGRGNRNQFSYLHVWESVNRAKHARRTVVDQPHPAARTDVDAVIPVLPVRLGQGRRLQTSRATGSQRLEFEDRPGKRDGEEMARSRRAGGDEVAVPFRHAPKWSASLTRRLLTKGETRRTQGPSSNQPARSLRRLPTHHRSRRPARRHRRARSTRCGCSRMRRGGRRGSRAGRRGSGRTKQKPQRAKGAGQSFETVKVATSAYQSRP